MARDPELRTVPSGQSVASFAVATNRVWQNQDGETQEQADFHNIVAWGKLAELTAQYLSKGRKVMVVGRLQTRSWEGEDGKKNYRTEVVANDISFLDRPGEGSSNFSQVPPDEPSAPADGARDQGSKAKSAKKPSKSAKKDAKIEIEDLGDDVDLSEIPF
ncbi:single-stranded DNA-binding protein [Candidatus Microgenomates bacterium]|nr:single-stranded DNA-binding protein [Candidatus Microgenomates bacterium]